MIRAPQAPSVMLITDPRYPLARMLDAVDAVGRALGPGRLVVQLRDKAAAAPSLEASARSLRAATERVGAMLVINVADQEALRIAIGAGADGVHVPCRDDVIRQVRARIGPSAWVSVPVHADEEVTRAITAGATAVLASPIFETPGKGPPRGVGALVSARTIAGKSLAIYALGGVSPATAAACAKAEADGVAVIRALLDASDPAVVAKALDAPFQAVSGG